MSTTPDETTDVTIDEPVVPPQPEVPSWCVPLADLPPVTRARDDDTGGLIIGGSLYVGPYDLRILRGRVREYIAALRVLEQQEADEQALRKAQVSQSLQENAALDPDEADAAAHWLIDSGLVR